MNRNFLLHHFAIGTGVLPLPIAKYVLTPGARVYHMLHRLGLVQYYREPDFTLKSDLKPKAYFQHYRGHWQSYKYFDKIRPKLLQELQLPPATMTKLKSLIPDAPTTISVHVRRKEYLEDQRYGFLGAAYYEEAMARMQAALPDAHFLVFSDDIDWCRDSFKAYSNTSFIGRDAGLHDYEELMLMSLCDHHIVANSSFSWWGAWLCRNPQQQVIRPAIPFRDASLLYESYYPEHWIVVSNQLR